MVITNAFKLPTEEELDVPELNVTASALHTGAFHLGKYCEDQCKVSSPRPNKILQLFQTVSSSIFALRFYILKLLSILLSHYYAQQTQSVCIFFYFFRGYGRIGHSQDNGP